MTPQPKEYIITEDEMESLHAMTHAYYEQRTVEILQHVYTRPHTPAPTDEQCRICSEAIARAATLAAYREVMNKIEYRFGDTERGRRTIETCREVITPLIQQQVRAP
jgi:hypothetical protein